MKQDWAWRRPGEEPEAPQRPEQAAPEQAAPEEAANQRAAGTGEVSQGHDIRVAGAPVQEPRPDPAPPAQPARPDEPDEPALAKEEVATQFPRPETEPEPAEPEPAESRNAKPAEDVLERFMDTKAAERFRERWHEVQIGFVDDPRGSVGQAEELAAEVLNALSRTLNERKSALDAEWRTEGEGPDTEQLRLALRGYREFFNRILDL